MAGTGPDDLHVLAEEFRDVCRDALDTIPGDVPELKGAPDRVFVSPGTPVADCCEQLAIMVNPLTDRFTLPKSGLDKINVVTLVAVATRCVPTGAGEGATYKPPKVVALEAAARQIHADGWALWNHVFNSIRANTFLPRCAFHSFIGMQQVTPSGGCAGWQLTVQVSLDGYEE